MARQSIETQITAYLDNEDSPDIANPIHSTAMARAYGFSGPLVGGVTVWGWATDSILDALGEQWLETGWSEYSFRQPVTPGDELLIRLTSEHSANSWSVQMINQEDIACVVGRVGLGQASWSQEFVRPHSLAPTRDERTKVPLTLKNAQPGSDWRAMELALTRDLAIEFASEKQRTNNRLFVGESPIAHPSWIAGWPEQLMRHNYAIPSSMHTKSRVQHLKKVPSGTQVLGNARVIEAYERKAHHLVNFDVLLQDQDGAEIAQLRHWTIFKIATPQERTSASG